MRNKTVAFIDNIKRQTIHVASIINRIEWSALENGFSISDKAKREIVTAALDQGISDPRQIKNLMLSACFDSTSFSKFLVLKQAALIAMTLGILDGVIFENLRKHVNAGIMHSESKNIIEKVIPVALKAGITNGKQINNIIKIVNEERAWESEEAICSLIPAALEVGIKDGVKIKEYRDAVTGGIGSIKMPLNDSAAIALKAFHASGIEDVKQMVEIIDYTAGKTNGDVRRAIIEHCIPAILDIGITDSNDIKEVFDAIKGDIHYEKLKLNSNNQRVLSKFTTLIEHRLPNVIFPAFKNAGITDAGQIVKIVKAACGDAVGLSRLARVQYALPAFLDIGITDSKDIEEIINVVCKETKLSTQEELGERLLPRLLRACKAADITDVNQIKEIIKAACGNATRDHRRSIIEYAIPAFLDLGITDTKDIKDIISTVYGETHLHRQKEMINESLSDIFSTFKAADITDSRSIIEIMKATCGDSRGKNRMSRLQHAIPALLDIGITDRKDIEDIMKALCQGIDTDLHDILTNNMPSVFANFKAFGITDTAKITEMIKAAYFYIGDSVITRRDNLLHIIPALLDIGIFDSKEIKLVMRAIYGHSSAQPDMRKAIPSAFAAFKDAGITGAQQIAEIITSVCGDSIKQDRMLRIQYAIPSLLSIDLSENTQIESVMSAIFGETPFDRRNNLIKQAIPLALASFKAVGFRDADLISELINSACKQTIGYSRQSIIESLSISALEAGVVNKENVSAILSAVDEKSQEEMSSWRDIRSIVPTLKAGITNISVIKLIAGVELSAREIDDVIDYLNDPGSPAWRKLYVYFNIKHMKLLETKGFVQLQEHFNRDVINLLFNISGQIVSFESEENSFKEIRNCFESIDSKPNALDHGWGELSMAEEFCDFLFSVTQLEKKYPKLLEVVNHWAGSDRAFLLKYLTHVNESLTQDMEADIHKLITNIEDLSKNASNAFKDNFLEAIMLMNILSITNATYKKKEFMIPEFSSVEDLIDFNQELIENIKKVFTDSYQLNYSLLKEEIFQNQSLFKEFLIYAFQITDTDKDDLGDHEKQLLVFFYMSLEFKGLYHEFKKDSDSPKVKTLINELFTEAEDREFVLGFLEQRKELDHFPEIFEVMGITSEERKATLLNTWFKEESLNHEATAMSPLETLKQYKSLANDIFIHIISSPEEKYLLSNAASLPATLGKLGGSISREKGKDIPIPDKAKDIISQVGEPLRTTLLSCNTVKELFGKVTYYQRKLGMLRYLASLSDNCEAKSKVKIIKVVDKSIEMITQGLDEYLDKYKKELKALGYALKTEDSDGISSYNSDIERLIQMLDKHKGVLGEETVQDMKADALKIMKRVKRSQYLLNKHVTSKLKPEKAKELVSQDVYGYVESLSKLLNASTSTTEHTIFSYNHHDFVSILQHARQCLNCKTGSNSDTNVTLSDRHRQYMTLRLPGKDGSMAHDSLTDMLLGIHVYTRGDGSKGVAIVPDIPYGRMSQSYIEALMEHLREKASKMGVDLFIPKAVSGKFVVEQYINELKSDGINLKADKQSMTIITPKSPGGESYYEYDGHYIRREGGEKIALEGWMLTQ